MQSPTVHAFLAAAAPPSAAGAPAAPPAVAAAASEVTEALLHMVHCGLALVAHGRDLDGRRVVCESLDTEPRPPPGAAEYAAGDGAARPPPRAALRVLCAQTLARTRAVCAAGRVQCPRVRSVATLSS